MRRPSNFSLLRAKDTFRKIRYTLRREAELIDRTLGALGSEFGPRALPLDILPKQPVLHLSDAVFGPLERAAKVVLQEPEERGTVSAPMRPISALLRDAPLSSYGRGPSDFVAALHHYTRYLLRSLPTANFYVSEHAIESARQNLYGNYGALITRAATTSAVGEAPEAEHAGALVTLCAALALEFDAARPIRRLDVVPNVDPSIQPIAEFPNRFCATAIALAIAVASTRPGATAFKTQELLETGQLVSQARFARFRKAMDSTAPVERLAEEFQRLIPHLP